jgi:ATP-dependent RNA helicase DDX23/PRP28
VRSEIKSKIAELGFKEPTEIQKQAVPLGLAGRDVVGVAETVSLWRIPQAINLLNPGFR